MPDQAQGAEGGREVQEVWEPREEQEVGGEVDLLVRGAGEEGAGLGLGEVGEQALLVREEGEVGEQGQEEEEEEEVQQL